MDNFTINSKTLGKSLTFSRPGSWYVYVDLNGHSGTLGQQICTGGDFGGGTITAAHCSQDQFNRLCRNWYRAYLKWAPRAQNFSY